MNKRSKKEPERKPDCESLLIDTTLTLAGKIGWSSITLKRVSEQTDVPLDEVAAVFKSKWEILEAFRIRTDSLITNQVNKNWPKQLVRDRLFDIVMRRIEIIAPWKAGVTAISKHCTIQPLAGIRLFVLLRRSMDKMIEHVGASPKGPGRLAQSHGLTIIYLLVLRRWISDETADYGPTMAELNERLILADQLVTQFCSLRRYTNHP